MTPLRPIEPKYQWNASDYADHSSEQQKWAKELIDKIKLAGDESLLDIGCGDGKVTAEIASSLKNGKVVGIDNSDEMIALAKGKFPATKHPNLTFQKQDAQELSFRQEFDIIFSNATLHWVLDQKSILKGIFQALKQGGRVLVQMGGKGNAARVIEAIDEIIRKNEWKNYFVNFPFPYGFYSPDEYEAWLKEAGFDIIGLELKPKVMVHENIEQFKGWFRTTWLPYLHRIPIELRDTFINTVTNQYLVKNPADHGGKINTAMQRLEYLATRQG